MITDFHAHILPNIDDGAKNVDVALSILKKEKNDGVDIEFIELTPDNIVKVKLQGACGTCPHAKATLKQGVEQTLQQYLPEIKAVEDVVLNF